jgi:hypothetical protein
MSVIGKIKSCKTQLETSNIPWGLPPPLPPIQGCTKEAGSTTGKGPFIVLYLVLETINFLEKRVCFVTLAEFAQFASLLCFISRQVGWDEVNIQRPNF